MFTAHKGAMKNFLGVRLNESSSRSNSHWPISCTHTEWPADPQYLCNSLIASWKAFIVPPTGYFDSCISATNANVDFTAEACENKLNICPSATSITLEADEKEGAAGSSYWKKWLFIQHVVYFFYQLSMLVKVATERNKGSVKISPVWTTGSSSKLRRQD